MRLARSLAIIVVCCLAPAPEATAGQAVGRDAVRFALNKLDERGADPAVESALERLELDALRRELARRGPPDLSVLEAVLARLPEHAVGREAMPFSGLRRALEGWLALESLPGGEHLAAVACSILRSQDDRSPATRLVSAKAGELDRCDLKARLVALAALLSHYSQRPTDRTASAVEEQLSWLEARGGAKPLVDAVRQYYGHPNVWIDVSQDLLDDSVQRVIDRPQHVHDVVLHTPVTGRGQLHAKSRLVIEPAADRAVLKIILTGVIDTKTVGFAGPARIYARGRTDFRAEKRLVLDGGGLRILPTACTAEARTLSSSVGATKPGLRGRFIRRVAERRWRNLQDDANRESARHSEQRVIAAVDREADDLIKRLDRIAVGPILALAGGRSENTRVRFCTEKGMLRIGAVRGPLGAPPGRPPCDERRLFTVQAHSTLVARLWGGSAPDAGQLPALIVRQLQLGPWLWAWANRLLAPRLTPQGITLRDGRWGTLLPAGLGGPWLAVEWRPSASPDHVAARPSADRQRAR